MIYKFIKQIYGRITFLKRLFYRFKIAKQAAKVGSGLKVNENSKVSSRTFLGDNVNFNGMKIRGNGKVVIGNNFHSGEDCLMITQVHNYDNGKAIPYDNTYISKDIFIEDNVWIGSRVIILGGVTIGEGAIIQAGSTVVNGIPKYAIAGGHPAKVFKYRDLKHYLALKEKQKFH